MLGVNENELFCPEIEDSFGYDTALSKEARDIINLLPYTPANAIRKIRDLLEQYKRLSAQL
ncbi:hypothetical protein FACS1894103_2130 [Campylobacterota bacterium]|nr:hypothetical protein FACS1894103_2130 [Campylobacterota bacterium]